MAAPRLVKLTDEIAFAVQPTESELKNLDKAGFKAIINMREEDEAGFIKNEKEIAESLNIKYSLNPIKTANDFTKEYTDNLLQTIDSMPKPVLVHCNVGLTAAAGSLMWAAKQMNAPASQVIEWGNDFGYNFAFHPGLYNFLQDYLRQNNN